MKISGFEAVLNGKGAIMALTHKIQNILKIFDHITFHIAMSVCFFIAATADVANSGNDVQIATTVNQMMD